MGSNCYIPAVDSVRPDINDPDIPTAPEIVGAPIAKEW